MGMGSAGVEGTGMEALQGFDGHVGFVTQGHELGGKGTAGLGGISEGFPTPFSVLLGWGQAPPQS